MNLHNKIQNIVTEGEQGSVPVFPTDLSYTD